MSRPCGQPYHQLMYTAGGSGTAVFDGTKHQIEKGTLFYSPANSAHEYYSAEEPWVTYWVLFGGTASDSFFNYRQGIWTPAEGFDFINIYRQIFALRDNPQWAKNSGVILYDMLCRCLDFIPVNSDSVQLGHRLSSALEYMENNYRELVEIRTLAGLTGVSPEHFCRIFKAYTGIRPLEYLTSLRINKAKTALINCNLPVAEIARRSGFESAAYFSKQFKKSEGITPTDFRIMYKI